jgi:DNA-binding LacI/PurR family transcriptional regulator
VSAATVSRVLTGSANVQPGTRTKVERAMAQLGYVRHRAAWAARPQQQAGSIALVVGEENIRVFNDPFFARLMRGVSKELAAADLQLVVLTVHTPREYHTVSRYLRSGHVDGAFFVSMHSRPNFDLGGLGIPVVLCGRPVTSGASSGNDRVSYIDADNVEGARQAVSYLLSSGRTTIATIAGPPDMSPGIDRLVGYRKAMSAAGINDPGLMAYGDFTSRAGEHALRRLIDLRPRLDAVFVASDLMAVGALRALARLGRRVPDDVAVLGFDDLPLSQHTEPRLSTVHQPIDAMASAMVRQALKLVSAPGEGPARIVLDTELVLRDSA